ncbi:MaoC/PaaZ C-terminal domain-containing protein [Pseudactinotalea sp. HY158]|uniref:MaoC/PaaZ C-terminal domain-containing protein n=1 Tax=Pseudactinotalea sp. HY158 TaxID=2654547 RepID=UPI00129CDC08|nr:MaoC/PaaZ C-terminal domain-containing protein [Pseudactinotalea sp. HY158]QGH70447.1 acyl dehydratase [Pseudactinotalea sp. HY158]
MRTTLAADAQIGTVLFEVTRVIDRARLVRYAGASGDFNPIHYSDRVATEVGLGGVIAHGMLTMGLAGAALTDWLGDPADLLSYGVRFTRPVPVPDPGEVALTIVARIGAIEADDSADSADSADSGPVPTARIDLAVTLAGKAVLGKAQARVRLT